ncbi:hypothetical protein PVAND_005487 [Polypedilum vanderplanki]|uniref:ERCC4 domain-containing protein n=1 Tax=Polypedilum vanderplanki TaxID=319348 RepID=A0A9J6C0S4_POLVA|nr:hypothetical protein PVAND_005487 [Polypedilum vanderplanki]
MGEKEDDRNDKKLQKERKRIEIQKRKFQLEQERMIKPGECNKFLTANIDSELLKQTALSKIKEKFEELNINIHASRSSTPNTITWKRRISQRIINDNGDIINFDDVEKDEPYLMVILMADSFVKAVKENKLLEIIQAAQEMCSNLVISTSLIIYGLKAYCRKHKNTITVRETEIKLVQIQMLANCSHRMHENPEDLALTCAQMSKSIAEEPFKNKQNQKLDQEQFFLTSDTKINACENDRDSLSRLWHAQLNCLPKVTFDVAQSITKEYSTPTRLIEAYRKYNNKNQMLTDIPIIRTGPLSKTRRIGPELSRKIATLMTSKNPNDLL